MSEEAAYKLRTVFMQSVVLNSQTTPSHAATPALWFPQGLRLEFQPGRLVAISGLFRNRFWSANTKGPTKHPQNTIVFSHYKWKSTEKHGIHVLANQTDFQRHFANKGWWSLFISTQLCCGRHICEANELGFDLQLPIFTISFVKNKMHGHKIKIIDINITITITIIISNQTCVNTHLLVEE